MLTRREPYQSRNSSMEKRFIGFQGIRLFAGFGSVAGLGGKAFHECPSL